MHKVIFIFIILSLLVSIPLFSQKKSDAQIREMIETFKASDRGPYKDIRWFCKDGSINMPKEPCGEKGGVQRARYNDAVTNLVKTNHIYLGQILSNTPVADFWDVENGHSRLKQYQLEKFLRAVNDGWVLRKAQFYRGAIQVEDEEEWGIKFFQTILADNQALESNFYLLRQAAKDIPHAGDTDLTQKIRALSKTISDNYPPFMKLRIKIHGQPDQSDIVASEAFRQEHEAKLSKADLRRFEEMIAEMKELYKPLDPESLNKYVTKIPEDAAIRKDLERYISLLQEEQQKEEIIKASAELLLNVRKNITSVQKKGARLALLDLSIAIEEVLFKGALEWQTASDEELMKKVRYLGIGAAGCGYLELWEWERISPRIALEGIDNKDVAEMISWHEDARRVVEWSTGMARGVYRPVVELYSGFEPLAYGFYDDKIRSSVLLPLGNAVSELGTIIADRANYSNNVLDLKDQSSFRGLNPGFALGELVVVDGPPEEVEVSKDKIYIFHHPASDLKPVAGIATVTEGNMVSHVQLLARNLGIPNAVLSEGNLKDLNAYHGKRVFYAVSNKGTVLMKPEEDMTERERKLFEAKTRSEERIRVPVDQLDLQNTSVLNLRDVNAKDSGKRCGPKAANLGQLKAMFPDKVVEGIVIPFSIFRQHMDLPMPGQSVTYWEFLNNTFTQARQKSAEEEETFVLQELATFRDAIKQIPLKDDFLQDLENTFQNAIGQQMGKIPVFLRSDTNMEDLKDFTGAGLNLTLFNVLEKDKILQGIKDVWASPYTERSYKWRQKYLLNPENVYPSILIIPGVDVDYSGVLITKGITSGNPNDLTVAFSRGAGGAVDGQAAESYLLTSEGENILLSPAREPTFRSLPLSGGTLINYTGFAEPILNKENLEALRELTENVNRLLPTIPGVESSGPFDIELGFKDDKMWLFQIRPFVENKNAAGSAYLESITPDLGQDSGNGSSDKASESISGQRFPVWGYVVGILVLLTLILIFLKRRS